MSYKSHILKISLREITSYMVIGLVEGQKDEDANQRWLHCDLNCYTAHSRFYRESGDNRLTDYCSPGVFCQALHEFDSQCKLQMSTVHVSCLGKTYDPGGYGNSGMTSGPYSHGFEKTFRVLWFLPNLSDIQILFCSRGVTFISLTSLKFCVV